MIEIKREREREACTVNRLFTVKLLLIEVFKNILRTLIFIILTHLIITSIHSVSGSLMTSHSFES